ncbi:ATP12 family chaperone protein [Cypionkella sp.]|uniref:ATP12 family chaperone protein n=1 Tax=Cypionkella sp. TaxID=2811411 RepID=UPI0026100DBB|nr:ATP12 family protein [Cypionkella sp.]MDB5666149.1 ATPase [Cypionkella sp.]
MSGWTAKRFWKQAVAEPCDGGFTITLDGRPVKTPAKRLLVLPTLQMAQIIAAEWDAQQGRVRPETMPATRAANSALDNVAIQFHAVARDLARYGETDLLCYRATDPEELVNRQADAWDPLLAWSATALRAPLIATAGVMHIRQPQPSIDKLTAHVHAFTPFQLAAVHDLIAISGSLVLALAVTRGRLSVHEAWRLSRIDETWQNELWGVDEDAAALESLKRQALIEAAHFFALCG